MILDLEPIDAWVKGAYVLVGDSHCRPAEPLTDAGEALHMNHWATCPQRDRFRRK